MPLRARQITLVASTATPLLVKGTTGTKFPNIAGTVSDPIPIQLRNEDAAAIIWIGGPDVDATHGQSLKPGETMPLNVYGFDGLEIPYAFSTGTPIISVLAGRQ